MQRYELTDDDRAAVAAAASYDAWRGVARSPYGGERNLLDPLQRRRLARHARALRLVQDGARPLPSLAAGRDLGTRAVGLAPEGGRGGTAGLRAVQRGLHQRPRHASG